MAERAVSFGATAAAYERFRPGYPYGLVHAAASPRWPGPELRQSAWFTDVRQSVVERRWAMSAGDYLGHLSAVSAYLVLPSAEREEAFRRMARVLPEVVEMDAGLTVHLARRCED